jgi:hypothetical protein
MKNNRGSNQSITDESRRDFVRKVGLSLGGLAACSLVAGNSISTALAYSAKSNSADIAGYVFSQSQMNILKYIVETILPATDTPSGADVDCHGFIDHQLTYCHNKAQQQQSITIVDKIAEYSNKHYQLSYANISSKLRTDILNSIEAEQGFTSEDKKGFKFLKALIVFGFFTTEVGATQALNYQAVPGEFNGSIPYTKESKAWGSLGFY